MTEIDRARAAERAVCRVRSPGRFDRPYFPASWTDLLAKTA
ncbi:hypothetical protein GA0115257_108846 [Streptomyces sp. LcepLS]|nr:MULTISPECIES: hypothetical protein [unclassified Streptomyces]SCD49576.1 hypothetical protein GA0115251_109573 [Streptomyces sp. TverLS-915]SCF22319.1 hypothetical protein GA0115257_108846 [Streptomyces sp. LcepLS]